MKTARAAACSALLQDGRILVAGGNTDSGVTNAVEFYGPNGTFLAGPPMHQARASAACVTLQDGRLLMTGGTDGTSPLSTAEMFDPAGNTWTPINNMGVARSGHTATLLPWGAVLVAGGENTGAVEIYRLDGFFIDGGKLSSPRQNYAVVALASRRVLIVGGTDGTSPLSTVDVYSADDNSITSAGQMLAARSSLAAAALLDGTVLVTGGYDANGHPLQTTEIFNPTTGESVAGPDMGMPRAEHQAFALTNNGSILLTGGTDGVSPLTYTQVYSSITGAFATTAPMHTARTGLAASLMLRGGLVVAGGRNANGFLPGGEAYGFATISTGKRDYHPGEVATFSGTGFVPGEQVAIKVIASPADQHNTEFTGTATADGNGQIALGGFNIDTSHVNMKFLVTATGSQSATQNVFTDGTTVMAFNPNNLTAITPASGTATAPVQITVAVTDGLAAAQGTIELILDGVVTTSLQATGATANYTFGPNGGTQFSTPGSHSVQAAFLTSGTDTGSSTTTLSYAVNAVASNIAFTGPSAASGVFNTAQALTATVSGTLGPASGQVTFTDLGIYSAGPTLVTANNVVIGGGPKQLSAAGQATADISDLLPTSALFFHLIQAVYTPAANSPYGSSSGNAQYRTIQAAPTYTLQLPANLVAGQPFSATVIAAPVFGINGTTYTPTTNVTLSQGAGNITPAQPMVSGTTTFNNVVLPFGSGQTLEVIQQVDPYFFPGTYAINNAVNVSAATPTVSVAYNPSSTIYYGQSFTYSATVTPPLNNTLVPTGSVNFNDGTVNQTQALPGAPPNNPSVSYTVPATTTYPIGSHVLTAAYTSGNTSFANVTNTSTSLTVLADTTTTTVGVGNASIGLGTTDTVSATVTLNPNVGSPNGSVAFSDNGTLIGGCTAVSVSGVGNPITTSPCTYTPTAGTHAITAVFTPTPSTQTGSTATPVNITVGKGTVTLSTLAGPASLTYGTPATYTVNVGTAAGAPATTAEVQFYDNGNPVGALVAPAAGVATLSGVILSGTPSVHNITAQYLGDTNFAASNTIGGVTTTVTKFTIPNGSFTALPVGPISIVYGTAFPGAGDTATLTGVGGGAAPGGSMTLSVGSTQVGGALPVVAGVANFNSIPLPTTIAVAAYGASFAYAGDNNYAAATYTVASPYITVTRATLTSQTLASSNNPAGLNQPVTFTLTLVAAAGTPVGTANFVDNTTATTLNGGTPVAVTNGVATFTTSTLSAGNHAIVANYLGDTNFNTVTATLTGTPQVIGAATSTATVSPVSASVTLNSTDSITASVAVTPNSITTIGGTVAIQDNGSTISGCGALALGAGNPATTTTACVATLTTAGTHNITAVYSGATGIGGSTSPQSAVTVTKGTATLSALGTTSTVTYGTPTSYTVSVTTTGTAPAPGAFVQFYDNGVAIGSPVAPVGGALTTTATSPSVTLSATPTSHTITAQFLGDTNYSASNTASGVTTTVNKATPSFSFTNFPVTAAYASNLAAASTGIPAMTVSTASGTAVAATGTFTVFQNAVQIGGTYSLAGAPGASQVIGNLPATIAACGPTPGPCGTTYPLTITYSGDNNYASGSPATAPRLSVTQVAPSSQSLTSSLNGAGLNQAVTFTLTVNAAAGTPGGTANFLDGATVMNGGTPVTVTNGIATFTTSTLIAGNHTISANYLGDTNFSAVSNIAMSGNPEVIGGASSTTTVSPVSASVTLNSTDSITASVAVTPNSITTIGGTVAIQDNGSTISGCGALALGAGNPATTTTACVATLTTAGTHNITAVYSGATGIGGSTSPQSAVTVTKGTVTLSALGTTSTVTYGTPTSYTVSVTTTGTAPAPGAFVQFYDNGVAIGSPVAPVGGALTTTATSPSVTLSATPTSHTITAQFLGDTNYSASNTASGVTTTVNKANPPTATIVAPAATPYGGTIVGPASFGLGAVGTGVAPTGTFTIMQGITQVGGTFTLTPPTPVSFAGTQLPAAVPAGTDTLNFLYSGDNNYNGSPAYAASTNIVVNRDVPTLVSFTAGPEPSAVGSQVTFTVTLKSPQTGTPTGTVTFYDAHGSIGTGTLNNVGTATFATSSLLAGSHSITWSYATDNNFSSVLEPSVAPLTHVVGATNTTVSITASSYAPNLGTQVTYTVTATSPSGTLPPVGATVNAVTVQDQSYGSGTVCTIAGASLLPVPGNLNQISGTCISPVYNGTAATVQASGVHNIVAQFASSDTTKWSTGTSGVITVTAGATPTTISVVSVSAGSPSAPYIFGGGSTLGFTVTISPTTGNPAYTGRVQFFDNYNNGTSTVSNQLCSGSGCPVPNGSGVATLGAQLLGGGTHSVTAQFLGDTNYGQSAISAIFTVAVVQTPSTGAGAYTHVPSGSGTGGFTFGQPVYGSSLFGGVNDKVTFSRACPTCAYPSGLVTATITLTGGTVITLGTYPINAATGVAQLTTTALPPSIPAGTQTITLSYPGDSNYAADPDTGTVGIAQAVPVVNFTSSSNPIAANTPLTFAITLSSPTTGTPTGSVTFKDGGVTLPNGTVTLVSGVASLTTSSLASGTHVITAVYSTDTNFSVPAAVPTISQVISTGNTSVSLSASTSTPAIGTTVTFSATVTAPPNSLVPATGSINVFDSNSGPPLCAISAASLAAGTVTNGNIITQSCTSTYGGTAPGNIGVHNVNAVFTSSAPAQFSNATSSAITITAGLTATTIGSVTSSNGFVSSNNYQYVYGNTTSLSAKVTPNTGSPANPAFAAANTVQFYDNGTTLLGSAQPSNAAGVGNGVATLTGVVLGGGTHDLTAQFIGNAGSGAADPNYAASATSIITLVTVTPASPTLTVGGAPFTVTFGGGLTTGPISLAGVTQIGSSFAAPTGAVTVKSGATTVGSAVTGAPTSTTGNYTFGVPTAVPVPTSLGVGSNLNLTFSSAADANYLAATFTTAITINKTTTAVTIASPTIASLVPGVSPVYGQPVSLVATFTTISGASLANGDTVSFTDGGSALSGCSSQPVTTSNGVSSATCTLPATIGATPAFAVASGHNIGVTGLSTDPNYTLGGVTTLAFNVVKANSVTLLTSSTNPSTPGQTVTFSSATSVAAPGGEVPLNTAQTVTFMNAGAPISAACTSVAINAAGQATCTIPTNSLPFTTAGNYNITAVFSGDANVATSTSGLLVQSLGHPQPAITVTSNNPSSAFGAPVTFTSTVTGTNGVTPTGQIQFSDGTTVLGTVALAAISPAGTASASITIPTSGNNPLANGTHAIYATYVPNGDQNYSTVTTSMTQTVTGAGTAITPVSISVNPAVFGQPVSLTVTVSPAVLPSTGVPTGSITFYDGGNAIGNPVTLVAGSTSSSATLTGVTLPTGTHSSITAKYSGDTNFGAVTSGSATLVINRALTLTAVTSVSPTLASYPFGTAITLNAQVTIVSPGAIVGSAGMSGTVSFYDGTVAAANLICISGGVTAGGNANCAATVQQASAGVAGFTASPFVGTHNIIAVYNGGGSADPNFLSSTSPSIAIAIGQAATTTAVTSSTGPSPSASVTGQLVTFTASITATGSFSAPPTGTVTFSNNGVPMGTGTVTVSGGVASAVLLVPSSGLLPLPDGTDLISATYSGDNNYKGSNSPASGAGALQQVVGKAGTTTNLSSSSNSTIVGQGVTLTALMTVNAPGGGTPTGTVIFNNTVNNIPTPLAGCSVGVQLNPAPGQNTASQFIAQCTPTSIPQGSLQLTAVYSGDSNYNGSTSPIITQIVNRPVTGITMSASNNPILYGTPVIFSATVAPLPPGTGTPSGTCIFYDGVTTLGTATLLGGVCTYNAPLLAVGVHSISTQYGGDANYQGVIGDTLTEVVNKLPSAISLTSNSVNAVASQIVTFTAQISPFPPAGVSFPQGQVAFMDGSTQIGVGNLSSGLAAVSTASLSFGVHYISAVYIGDQNWAGATSAFVPQNVTLAQTSTQLSSSVNPSVWGQPVTFTISTGVAFPGTVPAAGQVQLFDNTVALGAPANIGNGSVTVTVPSLAPGTHNIIAQYIGGQAFGSSNSAPISQTVNKAPTQTTLALLPTSSSANQQITLTAVVAVPSPGSGTPTGNVQFMDTTGNTVLGTAPLTNIGGTFTATLNTSQLSQAGALRLLAANYTGDADFAGSASPAQAESVSGTTIAVTNAAGYTASNFAPASAAAIFVSNLVNTTLIANTLPLPTSLSGVTVTVTDAAGTQQLAQLYFVSPGQINFLLPANIAFGLATITVTNAGGATASGSILITHTAPGIFTASQNGQGVAMAQYLDVAPTGGQTYTLTAQFDPNTGNWVAAPITMEAEDTYFLQFYGTGLRYAAANQVTATINGVSVPVLYAGAQSQFPGLDQVNIQIPASMNGAGTVPVVIVVNGQAANTVTVTFN